MNSALPSAGLSPLSRYDRALAELIGYLDLFPHESPRHSALYRWMTSHGTDESAEAIFARSNMTGHLTASLVLLDRSHENLLVIHHRIYDKWLQMGGHIDPEDLDAFFAAVRESCEEAGVPDASYVRRLDVGRAPIDIDSHPIKANPAKGEGAHSHHDFMYVAELVKDFALTPLAAEVHGVRWMPRAEMRKLDDLRMSRIADKLDAFFPISRAAAAPRQRAPGR